jgi:cell division protein FtsW (lipid II flippase)
VVCLLLIAVYFFPAVNGAHRWLRFGGVGFQPSELAKIVFVITLARYLMFRKDQRTWRGFVVPFLMAMLPALLIVREPDLGTSLVFFPVLLLMLFWAGARKADLVKVALAGLVIAPLLWTQMSREQQSRVTALFQQTVPGQQPHDDAYHLRQAKRMLTHGGLWGSYFNDEGIPDSAAYHLPEAHTDFVFCMIGERFGLGGTGLVVALWGILVWRALAVAEATREPFGRLLAAGIAGLFGVEVVINLAMTVGLAPITGLALPMVSYGGSALLAHATAIGLLINVAARPGYEISREPFRFATV